MILGMNYSKRKSGNCRGTLEVLESCIAFDELTIIDVPDFSIKSCCDYNYACFETGSCCVKDNFSSVLDMIREADKIIVTVPVYRGHLCSEYYKFHERICGVYRLDDNKLISDYLDKTTFVIFVNHGAGDEEAIIDLKRDIEPYGGNSKIITIASRDFDESSIHGNLKANDGFKCMILEEFGLI